MIFMKKILNFVLCLFVLFNISGCGQEEVAPHVISGFYMMEREDSGDHNDPPYSPRLSLNTETGWFLYTNLAECPGGYYHIEGDIVVAVHYAYDGEVKYLFRIIDEKTLQYIAEGSSELLHGLEEYHKVPYDGAIFHWEYPLPEESVTE